MMLSLIIEIVALLSAGTMVGNELAIAAIVHPSLSRLDDETHARSAKALATILGRIMPFWYAATLLFSVAVLLIARSSWNLAWWLTGISSLLLAACIVFTIVRLVPINNRVSQWDPEKLPGDWKKQREHWDRLHRFRVWLLFAALTSLTLSVAL